MPILTNPRHELFAQELAAGKSAAEGYVIAGFKDNRHNAATLARSKHIITRVLEIQAERQAMAAEANERVVEAMGLSRARVMQMLLEDHDAASAAGQHNAAIKATQLLGMELHKMFVNRHEHNGTLSLDQLSLEQLGELALALRQGSDLGGGRGASTSGAGIGGDESSLRSQSLRVH